MEAEHTGRNAILGTQSTEDYLAFDLSMLFMETSSLNLHLKLLIGPRAQRRKSWPEYLLDTVENPEILAVNCRQTEPMGSEIVK